MVDLCGLPLWLKISSGLLTPVIAVIAVYIAFQQQKINRLRLKHELFERRLAIYDSLKQFLGLVMREGKTSYETCITLLRDTNQSPFLFGAEISTYIEMVYNKGLELAKAHQSLHGDQRLQNGEDRNRTANQVSEILTWFSDQFDISRKHFEKYLSLNGPNSTGSLKRYQLKRKDQKWKNGMPPKGKHGL
jgi:hypothetical protein